MQEALAGPSFDLSIYVQRVLLSGTQGILRRAVEH
jgi:hypothetical protein